MIKMEKCYYCQKELSKDDIGLCKKLLGKKIKQFFCREHLAEVLDTDVETLTEKIEQFKEEGCTLFL